MAAKEAVAVPADDGAVAPQGMTLAVTETSLAMAALSGVVGITPSLAGSGVYIDFNRRAARGFVPARGGGVFGGNGTLPALGVRPRAWGAATTASRRRRDGVVDWGFVRARGGTGSVLVRNPQPCTQDFDHHRGTILDTGERRALITC